MSRTRRAGIAAAYGYLQFGLALTSGIVLVPFVLARVGTEAYGVWLAFGEMLAYSAMVELGVVNVLPWLVAEADGRGDRAHMRDLVAAAFVFSVVAALAFAALAFAVVKLAPGAAGLTAAQRALVAGPLLLTVGGMAASFPLRTFQATLTGLQDVGFAGAMSLSQVAVNVVLVIGLLAAGQGLYALAAAAVAPPVFVGVVSLLRLRARTPELLRGWRWPSGSLMRSVTAQGLGSWTAGLGWRMVAASNGIVVLSVAGPEAAVVYAMTAKLGEVAMQMSWQVPDAGLVGLAQLKGEGRDARVREVALSMVRLVLLGSGAVACGVLAFNPSFVSLWVGPSRFGGVALNALLALVVLAHSLTHGLFTTSATLGTRVQAGWASLAQGAVHLGAAVLLGRAFGLPGVAAAAVASTALVAYPSGVAMLRKTTGLGHAGLWREVLGPWAVRVVFLLALGAAVGWIGWSVSRWAPLVLAPALGVLYLWVMRPLYLGLPLPERLRRLLVRLRLVPGEAP